MRSPSEKVDVDTESLHKLYSQGLTYAEISKELGISMGVVSLRIAEQREIEPDKWPGRRRGRRKTG